MVSKYFYQDKKFVSSILRIIVMVSLYLHHGKFVLILSINVVVRFYFYQDKFVSDIVYLCHKFMSLSL